MIRLLLGVSWVWKGVVGILGALLLAFRVGVWVGSASRRRSQPGPLRRDRGAQAWTFDDRVGAFLRAVVCAAILFVMAKYW